MAKYDIIIPVHNQGELTRKCLESVKRYSKDYRVILIDNASEPNEYNEWLEIFNDLEEKWLVVNEENIGFVKAVNQGIRESQAPFVVLLNNDTEVADHWLEELERPFDYRFARIGCAGCLSVKDGKDKVKLPHRRGYEVLSYGKILPFFCVMISREVLESVGLLNESFGMGFYDDDDYCRRVEEKGYKLARTFDLTIIHKGRSTFESLYSPEEIKAMMEKNRSILKGKNEIPDGDSDSSAKT
jgi:O-antigen biosynthesis protein